MPALIPSIVRLRARPDRLLPVQHAGQRHRDPVRRAGGSGLSKFSFSNRMTGTTPPLKSASGEVRRGLKMRLDRVVDGVRSHVLPDGDDDRRDAAIGFVAFATADETAAERLAPLEANLGAVVAAEFRGRDLIDALRRLLGLTADGPARPRS
jgi:hypothetical protein